MQVHKDMKNKSFRQLQVAHIKTQVVVFLLFFLLKAACLQILDCLFFYFLLTSYIVLNFFLLNRTSQNIWLSLNAKRNMLVFLYFLIYNRNK